MSLPIPLPPDLAELIASRFRALGDPLRVRLVDQLRSGELTVNELADRVGASQQNVSRHLVVLTDAGVLGRRKEGIRVHYRIVDEGVLALCEQVCGSLQAHVAALAAVVDAA